MDSPLYISIALVLLLPDLRILRKLISPTESQLLAYSYGASNKEIKERLTDMGRGDLEKALGNKFSESNRRI